MSEASLIAEPKIRFAETDMLHRRTPLPYAVRVDLGGVTVLVRTNSRALQEGARLLKLDSQRVPAPIAAEWEIEVEACGEPPMCAGMSDAVELFTFGCSRSLRMANGSWFAWTPLAASGVGFAFVCGNEAEQATQLAEYLGTTAEFVSEHQDTRNDGSRKEDASLGVVA